MDKIQYEQYGTNASIQSRIGDVFVVLAGLVIVFAILLA